MAFPGGKGKCFHTIINLMPPHKVYVEPFLGSGIVVQKKLPALSTIVGDIHISPIQAFNSKKLPELSIHHSDALDLLDSLPLCAETMVYCDPPYLLETRKKGNIYRHEYSKEQHSQLLNFIADKSCMILLSGYDNDLYNDILQGWNKHQFQAQTQDGPRQETLWFNYPHPKSLHDSRYIGDNFRERQNIKRRQLRLRTKIDNMCPIERTEFIHWLTKNYAA